MFCPTGGPGNPRPSPSKRSLLPPDLERLEKRAFFLSDVSSPGVNRDRALCFQLPTRQLLARNGWTRPSSRSRPSNQRHARGAMAPPKRGSAIPHWCRINNSQASSPQKVNRGLPELVGTTPCGHTSFSSSTVPCQPAKVDVQSPEALRPMRI